MQLSAHASSSPSRKHCPPTPSTFLYPLPPPTSTRIRCALPPTRATITPFSNGYTLDALCALGADPLCALGADHLLRRSSPRTLSHPETLLNSPRSAKSGCFARRIQYSKNFLLRELVNEYSPDFCQIKQPKGCAGRLRDSKVGPPEGLKAFGTAAASLVATHPGVNF
jgi:hypothetical protein